MALKKIFTNISGNNLQVLNVELAPLESYELPYSQWAKAADSFLLKDLISTQLISVNNGTTTLNTTAALNLLVQFQTENDSAKNFSYNNILEEITIPENQQMIVKRRIKITDRLIIRGQLCLI